MRQSKTVGIREINGKKAAYLLIGNELLVKREPAAERDQAAQTSRLSDGVVEGGATTL